MKYTSLKQLLESSEEFNTSENFSNHFFEENGLTVEYKTGLGYCETIEDEDDCIGFRLVGKCGDEKLVSNDFIFNSKENPVDDDEIWGWVLHIEESIDERMLESGGDIDVECFIEEEEVDEEDEWVYGEVIPFRSDYFDEENIEY
jgi:hypothetical protein